MITKKHLLRLLIVLMLIPANGIAQEYLPFPQDSAEWYVVDSWPEYDPPPTAWFDTYKYETKGDTLIADIVYTKLYSTSALGGGSYHYEGAYRVDSESERVYFIDAEYGTESLLYDFKLVPGDTIIISGSQYEPFNLICLDTSTMNINNVPHHSYLIYSYLSNGTECYTIWVKGIGSLRNPIETDWFCAASFEWANDLSCFYYKSAQIYEWDENPYFEGCIGTNVGIENPTFSEINIKVAPNPFTAQFTLENLPENQQMELVLINSFGQVVYRTALLGEKPQQQITINQSLAKGLYILKIYTDKHLLFIQKVIKN